MEQNDIVTIDLLQRIVKELASEKQCDLLDRTFIDAIVSRKFESLRLGLKLKYRGCDTAQYLFALVFRNFQVDDEILSLILKELTLDELAISIDQALKEILTLLSPYVKKSLPLPETRMAKLDLLLSLKKRYNVDTLNPHLLFFFVTEFGDELDIFAKLYEYGYDKFAGDLFIKCIRHRTFRCAKFIFYNSAVDMKRFGAEALGEAVNKGSYAFVKLIVGAGVSVNSVIAEYGPWRDIPVVAFAKDQTILDYLLLRGAEMRHLHDCTAFALYHYSDSFFPLLHYMFEAYGASFDYNTIGILLPLPQFKIIFTFDPRARRSYPFVTTQLEYLAGRHDAMIDEIEKEVRLEYFLVMAKAGVRFSDYAIIERHKNLIKTAISCVYGRKTKFTSLLGTLVYQNKRDEVEEMVLKLPKKTLSKRMVDGNWNALHVAADNGDCYWITYLLENGANVLSRTKDMQYTAFHLVAAGGFAHALTVLHDAVRDRNKVSVV